MTLPVARVVVVIVFALERVAAGGGRAASTPRVLTEAQAQAGFLYNCALFVSWPPGETATEIVLAIIGGEPASSALGDLDGRPVHGRVLRVRWLKSTDALDGVHIVFFPGDDPRTAGAVLERLAAQPVLTVGGSSDFTRQGGAVRLYTDYGRVRFEINLSRVELAGLKVSAKMLSLARIVR